MIFGDKRRLIGLDIGSKSIKAAEIVATKKDKVLKKFGIVNIPSGLLEDGAVIEPDAIAEYIRELFKENKLKSKNVALSIGGYSVIVKKITIQTMSEEELQDTIQSEAEQYIPFDISDVNLDFQILQQDDDEEADEMNVLLVAAKKEMIADYINLTQLAGLDVKIIDVDAFALQNIFQLNYKIEDETAALIDIGNTKTSLNILIENSSLFMRDISLGCGQINQKIASLGDCSLDEAEQIKLSGQSDKISPERLRKVVSSVIADWCTEIRRAFDFFYSTNPDDQVRKIVLSGGGANIEEFRNLLAAETSANVEVINPFENFDVNFETFDRSYLKQIAPQAAISMGLALRRVDDK
jgi:type IV pilus assembly protein PilM